MRSRDRASSPIVQALAAWRERTAQARDLPRNRVLRDDLLLEVAANRPTSQDELAKLRRISLDRRSAVGVVEAMQAALALPQAALPRLEPPPKQLRGLGPMIELLRVLLKLQSEEHHVAQRLVATSADLEALAAEDAPAVAALKGWRYEVFGKRSAGAQARRARARDPPRPPRAGADARPRRSRHERARRVTAGGRRERPDPDRRPQQLPRPPTGGRCRRSGCAPSATRRSIGRTSWMASPA